MKGYVLRHLRQEAGLPGRLVCSQCGIERSRLSDIERGYVEPSPDEFRLIESAIRALAAARQKVAEFAATVGWPM